MIHAPIKVVFAGGATGGHLFPAIAIAQEFLDRNPENHILFISAGRPLEVSVLSGYGFALKKISAEGIKGRSFFRQMNALSSLIRGTWQATTILKDFRPDLVIGMGGYASVPVVLAAWVLRIPRVLCEQNILPGIANRFLSRIVDQVYVSFEHTLANLPNRKVRLTGNPVRKEILNALRQSKDENDPFTVLILGGSQGAHGINMAVMEALSAFENSRDYFFIHQTGEADEKMVQEAYEKRKIPAKVRSFFKDMARVYAKADLIICRAGATTVAEISALAKPAIFVPFPHAADDHQLLNAKVLCDAGAAEMVMEKDLTGEFLAGKIRHLSKERSDLETMAHAAVSAGRPDAAKTIADECYRLVGNYSGTG